MLTIIFFFLLTLFSCGCSAISKAAKHVTIVAGNVTDEAVTWLSQHGATIEEWNGLQVLTMQADQPSEGAYKHQYTVVFDNAEGDPEASYLAIYLEPNPYDTRVSLEFEGSYACTCKGRACTKCNEELAAIKRGDNPYAHHTVK